MTVAVTNWYDGFKVTDASADVGPYTVLGGRYALMASATWGGGTVTLQALMPDGSTYINIASPLTADGAQLVDLPPGSYKLDIVTATAVQASLVRVPFRAA